jgi:hypothetical protein
LKYGFALRFFFSFALSAFSLLLTTRANDAGVVEKQRHIEAAGLNDRPGATSELGLVKKLLLITVRRDFRTEQESRGEDDS